MREHGLSCLFLPNFFFDINTYIYYELTWTSIARRPIRTNCTTGVRTYFCKSTECPESWSSIAAAIAQVGFLSRRRQSKLCTSSAHFLISSGRPLEIMHIQCPLSCHALLNLWISGCNDHIAVLFFLGSSNSFLSNPSHPPYKSEFSCLKGTTRILACLWYWRVLLLS